MATQTAPEATGAREDERYPPIAAYALIGDCASAALVSRDGSIDWCCMPRLDGGACFARLLDWDDGGWFSIAPVERDVLASRRYLEGTLVLETTYSHGAGEATVVDCMTINTEDEARPFRQLLRVVEGVRGHVDLAVHIAPRFDYGAVRPWRRYGGMGVHTFIGGNDGLVLSGDIELEPVGRHDLAATISVRPGDRVRLSMTFAEPHLIDASPPEPVGTEELDRRLADTVDWWRRWSSQAQLDGPDGPGAVRSAIVLKGLTNAATGAIAAAATTSLPESPGGTLNWDYRFSWVRDSAFSVRSLAEIGCREEADRFRRFIERSAAGSAEDLQIMYGLGGERRLDETELDEVEGYRGARPVRVGNAAARQKQLDVYGELLELSWRWHERGHTPDDDYWRFIVDLVDAAAERWREPDRGLWEVRGEPQHFTHSKVMCWAALDRGIRIADASMRRGPVDRWRKERDAARRAIERNGYDRDRGVFVQAFGSTALDAAVLLLPAVGFVAWDDERMVRTVDAIMAELQSDGLVLRYRVGRGRGEPEGTFLACSFWLAECLARQRRLDEARTVFDRAVATANELVLFSEEYDTDADEMLGNFPQGLTHLSHIAAAVAIAEQHGAELTRA
jgi:GH15 family glucan-1,4-alpha-glucosidase